MRSRAGGFKHGGEILTGLRQGVQGGARVIVVWITLERYTVAIAWKEA